MSSIEAISGLKVMVIDDSNTIRRSAEIFLKQAGCEVVLSEDGFDGSFRDAAQSAVSTIAAVFEGWGPKVNKRIRSGSAANEIIKAAKQYDAGLVVVAAGGRGLSDAVLVGSTAQRVQHYAPCPVLVVRPAPKPRKRRA